PPPEDGLRLLLGGGVNVGRCVEAVAAMPAAIEPAAAAAGTGSAAGPGVCDGGVGRRGGGSGSSSARTAAAQSSASPVGRSGTDEAFFCGAGGSGGASSGKSPTIEPASIQLPSFVSRMGS